jgi:hypothetical protein
MNRRLPLILVAAVLVLCAIGVIIVGVDAGSGFGAVAYTVGDTKVSQQTVNNDLKALAEHNDFPLAAFAAKFRTTDGAVNSTGAAQWLSIEIYRHIASDVLARQGKKITDADRKDAVAAIASQSGPTFEKLLRKLPDGLQRRLEDVLVLQTRFQNTNLGKPHVTVDPKYGFWSRKNLAVCPPTGCPKAASSSTGG